MQAFFKITDFTYQFLIKYNLIIYLYQYLIQIDHFVKYFKQTHIHRKFDKTNYEIMAYYF